MHFSISSESSDEESKNDWNLAQTCVLFESPANVNPTDIRRHQVQQNQVQRLWAGKRQPTLAAVGLNDLKPFKLERHSDEPAKAGVIFYGENLMGHARLKIAALLT
jgi:hypothetical protein